MVAGKALRIGDHDFTDGLAVVLVGVRQRILSALDGEISGGVDAQIAVGHQVSGGEGDIAVGRCQHGLAACRQTRAADGVGAAVAVALAVKYPDRQTAAVIGTPAFGGIGLPLGLEAVRHIQVDAVLGDQRGVAAGAHAGALAGDAAAGGEDRQIVTRRERADLGVAGGVVLAAAGAA